jgi:dihydrofolate reductase
MINVIVAVSENGIIGNKGKIPWDIKEDMAFFKAKTIGQIVIMGRKTYESLKGALPKRINIVITRDLGYIAPGCIVVKSLAAAIKETSNFPELETFIIGGATIYEQALKANLVDFVYYTMINKYFEGDTYFPYFFMDLVYSKKGETDPVVFVVYEKPGVTAGLRRKAKQIGHSAMAGYLKNRNYTLDHALNIILGKPDGDTSLSHLEQHGT